MSWRRCLTWLCLICGKLGTATSVKQASAVLYKLPNAVRHSELADPSSRRVRWQQRRYLRDKKQELKLPPATDMRKVSLIKDHQKKTHPKSIPKLGETEPTEIPTSLDEIKRRMRISRFYQKPHDSIQDIKPDCCFKNQQAVQASETRISELELNQIRLNRTNKQLSHRVKLICQSKQKLKSKLSEMDQKLNLLDQKMTRLQHEAGQILMNQAISENFGQSRGQILRNQQQMRVDTSEIPKSRNFRKIREKWMPYSEIKKTSSTSRETHTKKKPEPPTSEVNIEQIQVTHYTVPLHQQIQNDTRTELLKNDETSFLTQLENFENTDIQIMDWKGLVNQTMTESPNFPEISNDFSSELDPDYHYDFGEESSDYENADAIFKNESEIENYITNIEGIGIEIQDLWSESDKSKSENEGLASCAEGSWLKNFNSGLSDSMASGNLSVKHRNLLFLAKILDANFCSTKIKEICRAKNQACDNLVDSLVAKLKNLPTVSVSFQDILISGIFDQIQELKQIVA